MRTNEVRSMHRVVRLVTPPAEGWARQILYVPVGTSDAQVIAWASEVLDPASLAELREVIERESDSS